jgi:hypothetical protein
MITTCPDTPPVFPPDLMERTHAELVIIAVGTVLGMTGSMIDLLASSGVECDQAADEADRGLARSRDEARELVTTVTGRAFDDIVEEFLRGARVPAADGSCRARELLERLLKEAH